MKQHNNPRVLLVGPIPPPSGGDSTWTVKYLKYNVEHGYKIKHVNTAITGTRSYWNINKVNIRDEIRRCFRIWTGIVCQSIQYRPQIVHLNSNCSIWGIYRDAISILLIKIFRKPVVFHCRCNVEYAIGKSKIRRRILRFIMNRANAIFVQNHFSLEFVTGELRQNNNKVYLMPNYIEVDKVADKKVIRDTLQDILYVGHASAEKGVGEVLKCAEHFPQLHFDIVGAITDQYRDYKEIEKRLGNVKFRGDVNLDQVRQYLDDADLFLFLSWSEGFSNALVEAMARGVPCVVSNAGANAEMIENKGGIVCKVKDVDAMVAAIEKSLDHCLRCRESEWNIKKVRREYTMDIVIKRIRKIYCKYIKI